MTENTTTAASGAASLAAAEKLPRYTYGYKSDEWGENRTPRPQADAGAAQLPNPEDPAVSSAIDKILAGYVRPATAKAYAYAGFEAARQLLAAAPQAPAAPTAAAAGAYAPLPKPYSAATALGLDDLYTGDDMRAYADAHRSAQAPAAHMSAQPMYQDSTPGIHVGDSSFEDWFQQQPFATRTCVKQIARDAYAAGMSDPLVVPAPAPVAGAAPTDAEIDALLDSQATMDWHLADDTRSRMRLWTRLALSRWGAAAPAQEAEDAARYRHIRACNSGSICIMKMTGLGDEDYYIVTEENADREVDAERAAMAARARQEGGAGC